MTLRRPRVATGPARRYVTKGADKFVAEGRVEEAARLAMISNHWEEAIDLYRLAQQPDLAAAAARRAGQLLVAAELYDLAGDAESAAVCRAAHSTLSSAPPAAPLPVVEQPIPKAPALPQLDLQLPAPSNPPPSKPRPETLDEHQRSGPPAVGSVPPHASFGSKPPIESAYSFISEPPAQKRSSPPRKAPPRRVRSTQPLGSKPAKPIISREEVKALTLAVQDAEMLSGEDRGPNVLAGLVREQGVDLDQRWLQPRQFAVGLESRPLDLAMLRDAAVQAAGTGDDIATLRGFVGDAGCDLANIEVYHRLGLAYAASGHYDHALSAFREVDETSPGYRHADRRVAALHAWHEALEGHGFGNEAPFDLLGELGRGSRAVVYRARHRERGEDVALKVFGRDDTDPARFDEEAHASASLNHPDIVRIHEHGVVNGRPWLSMDLLDGVALQDVFTQMTVVEKLEALVVVLDALAYAHDGEVMHGDIRPANIVLRASGRVVLTEPALTSMLGATAIPFMAPELLSGRSEEPRTDVFAVGVTAYALLSGVLPFEVRHRESKAPPLVGVPLVIAEEVQKALAFDPVSRWPSARAFARPLQTVLEAVRADAR